MFKILKYVWSGPHTLIGLFLALYYWPKSWRISEGCIEAIPRNTMFGDPGAQTHGCVIYYKNTRARNSKILRVHERVHVQQGFKGGIFYVIAYISTFAWFFMRAPSDGWYKAYMQIPFEKTAYRYDYEYELGMHPDAWGSKESRT